MKLLKAISPYIVIIGLVVLVISVVSSFMTGPELSYTQFLTELRADNVDSVKLEGNTATIKLKAQSKQDSKLKADEYTMTVHSQEVFEQLIVDETGKDTGIKVKYTAVDNDLPFIVRIIPYILFVLIFLIFLYMMFSQGQSGNNRVMNFGRSRARLYTSSRITFDQVAGAEEEKEEMQELVSFLKEPKRYSALGARIPKGVLMVGPPGTGKTYLAKAVAGEAGVPFFSISGSDFVEMYVGVGASRVRDLFEQAKKNAPCIIFIDEIDAVGRHRGAGLGGGHDEREQTLNQLLVEMDGFGINEGVIVMAATNRPDILDPALTRPGRFDRKIIVGYPDIKAREAILRVHGKNKPIHEEVDLGDVAKNTSGFTAADLENLLNEAALLAARDKQESIGNSQLKEAIFRVIVGPEKKSRVMTKQDKWLTAVHETGHAIAVRLLSSTEKVDRISIIPAGLAGGYTAHRPDEDKSYQTKAQLLEEIDICLGGRAAEELVLKEISTGASSDLKRANSVARNMITKYGMSDTLGNMVFNAGESDEVFIGKDYGHTKSYSEEMSGEIDREVKRIMDTEYQRVLNLLRENQNKLTEIAKVLMEKEKIEGQEFIQLMDEIPA